MCVLIKYIHKKKKKAVFVDCKIFKYLNFIISSSVVNGENKMLIVSVECRFLLSV